MNKQDIIIGKVAGTHGNKGIIKVIPITDFPDRFLEMEKVTLELKGRLKAYAIEEASRYRQFVLLKLAEIPDMNAAEGLKGALIKVGREDLHDLPRDSYYIFEIVGLKVYTPENTYLGEVEDIIQTGANDVYVIKTESGPPILVPALKTVVREVDIIGGRMVIDYSENS